jgi:hypothetical protein
MTASVVITATFPTGDPNIATHVLDFSATDDPRSGQISADIDITQTQTQIEEAIKQAVADYINAQRGATVIQAGDVRIP